MRPLTPLEVPHREIQIPKPLTRYAHGDGTYTIDIYDTIKKNKKKYKKIKLHDRL
jgi:hypothetical protein